MSVSIIDLAIEQLEVSIDLFISGRSYASAITLAGAAEEILGCYAKRQGESCVDIMYRIHEKTLTKQNINYNKPKAKFIKPYNNTKNRLKHLDKNDDVYVNFDLQWYATHIITRACANYKLCKLPENKSINCFNQWCAKDFFSTNEYD